MIPVRKAVVDVGSNSVLLTIEEKVGEFWRPLCETSEVSGLGEGTRKSGLLAEKGMAETLHALTRAFEKSKEFGVDHPVAAATMAARIATNTPDFLERARAQGTPVFVLSGDHEAELGFQAVANDPAFSDASRLSIIDVGGQSTELVTAERSGQGWTTFFRRSFPIGTLALLAGTLSEERPAPPSILRACAELDDTIGLAYRPDEAGVAIALGATGTNLVSIREKFHTWNPDKVHGAYLDYEEVSKAASWLFSLTFQERAALVGMEPGRERTLPIGALILERFMFATRVIGCKVSVRGWRHALLENGMPGAGTPETTRA